MRKDGHIRNRSDHAKACPQVFKETPKPIKSAAAPKKSSKKKIKDVVEEVAAEEVVEEVAAEEVVEEVAAEEEDTNDDES